MAERAFHRYSNATTEQRFFAKVLKTDTCWLWTASVRKDGYGRFGRHGRIEKANRVSWELANGTIPDGLNVLHKCDTPACVRPDHLFLGTHAENVADKVRKNRHLKGEGVRTSKLTIEQVRAIKADTRLHRHIAADYGISHVQVYRIKSGERWAHLR